MANLRAESFGQSILIIWIFITFKLPSLLILGSEVNSFGSGEGREECDRELMESSMDSEVCESSREIYEEKVPFIDHWEGCIWTACGGSALSFFSSEDRRPR